MRIRTGVAVKVYEPAVSIDKLLNVARPFTTGSVVVPLSVAEPLPGESATVTFEVLAVTVFPEESWTATVTGVRCVACGGVLG